MAISYLRATFPRLLPSGGAQKLFAYLGRYSTWDDHVGCAFSFERVARDLVFQAVVLPREAPAELRDPALLARAIDAAESTRMRKKTDRIRWQQVAASFVAALPPDSELTYDEAVELSHRLADYVCHELPIAAYLAIHDPARESPGAINRHLHLMTTTRGLDLGGLLPTKLPAWIASLRQKEGASYVAEGAHWPRIWAQMQTAFFAELGLDITVSPAMPIGDRHWPKEAMRNKPERVEEHRRKIYNLNRSIVFGSAKNLLNLLLRGRSSISLEELRLVIARVEDNEGAREQRLNEILWDLSTFAIHASDRRPCRVTTHEIHDLMQQALDTVARDQSSGQPLLAAISGSRGAITTELVRQIRQLPSTRIFLVGQRQYDCGELAEQMSDVEHTIVSAEKLTSSEPQQWCAPGDLIVVPRSEQVEDQWMARLVIAAAECGSRLVLGYDRGAKAGLVSNRLSARIAEALNPPTEVLVNFSDIEHELRCGRVDRAITSLAEFGMLRFANTTTPGSAEPDFVVCHEREVACAAPNAKTTNGEFLDHGPYTLAKGEWIAFSQTDYSVLPPVIRAGRLARIADILPEGRSIVVELSDSNLHEIDLTKFWHVRPASPLITLREARHAPKGARLHINLTKPQRAWSCVLAAAVRGDNIVIEVDPGVASDTAELIEVVQRNLPSALSTELLPCTDPDAEFVAIINGRVQSPPTTPDTSPVEIDLDDFPVPTATGAWSPTGTPSPVASPGQQPIETSSPGIIHAAPQFFSRHPHVGSIRTKIPRHLLHEKLWTILASLPTAQVVLDCLETLRGRKDAEPIYRRLLRPFGDQGATAALLRAAIIGVNKDTKCDQSAEQAIDAPSDLLQPRDWELWDLSLFRLHMQVISFCEAWKEIFPAMPPGRRSAAGRSPSVDRMGKAP